MELPNTRTSALPKSKVPFTKDTLEGDFHGYRREIWSHAARSIKEGHGGNDGVQLFFVLTNGKKAIVWGLFTGWYHPQVVTDWEETGIDKMRPKPEGGAVEWHSSEPLEGWPSGGDDCTLIDDGVCYRNIGFTLGEDVYDALCVGGFDAVWETLYELLEQETEEEE